VASRGISPRSVGPHGRRRWRSGRSVTPGLCRIRTNDPGFWTALSPSCWHGVTWCRRDCGFLDRACAGRTASCSWHAAARRGLSPDRSSRACRWEEFETFRILDSMRRRNAHQLAVLRRHTAVRIFVMGEAGYERARPTRDQAHAAGDARRWRGRSRFATSRTTHSGDQATVRSRADLGAPLVARAPRDRTRVCRLLPERRSRTQTCELQARLVVRHVDGSVT